VEKIGIAASSSGVSMPYQPSLPGAEMRAPFVAAFAALSSANVGDCGSRRYTGTRLDWVDRVAAQRATRASLCSWSAPANQL